MRKTLAMLLTLTVFMTAGFAFFAMHFNPECVSQLVEHASCKGGSNVLDFLFFHIGILQHASWAIVAVAMALSLIMLLGRAFLRDAELIALAFSPLPALITTSPRRDLQRWLSLHQKRGPDLA